jgi:hypothetical protein
MKLIALVVLSLFLTSIFVNVAYAQQDSRKVERITIPYTAANADKQNPAHYSFSSSHIANWILNVNNQLVYNSDNPDAKVVVRLKQDPSSEIFVELAMFGAPSHKSWLAVANDQVGYMPFYEDENSWFEDKPVMISYIQNERLSVTNGQRNVVDRLKIGPLVLNTVEVYGKDSADSAVNTVGGELVFDIISGNPMENPIMIMPAILAGLAGVAIVTLIKLKKRT